MKARRKVKLAGQEIELDPAHDVRQQPHTIDENMRLVPANPVPASRILTSSYPEFQGLWFTYKKLGYWWPIGGPPTYLMN